MKFRYCSVLWVSIAFSIPTFAAFGIASDGGLDTKTLRSAYKESDFEPVRVSVERYLKQRGDAATREEKIFAFKYLGVIYAADSLSRIRAESYFNRLLDLAPNIELIDMYVSPKIMEVFEGVKNERRKDERYREQFDAYGNPIKPVSPGESTTTITQKNNASPKEKSGSSQDIQKEESSKSWIWWTVGVAAVGAGVGLYVLSLDHGSSGYRTVTAGN